MKLLERERIETTTPRREGTAPRSIVRPAIRVRARVVSYPAPRRAPSGPSLVARVAVFTGVVGLTYVSSTLGGYVMLERARQQGRHGEERAAYARQEASAARESIESLTNPVALRSWAESHGFVTDGSKPVPAGKPGETRVALR